jgi:hypothetical protein
MLHGSGRDVYNLMMPQTWFDLASNARKAANRLVSDNYRSCVARAYYVAYSKVTHTLAAASGVTFPANREGPNHPGESGTGGIRRLIETSMPGLDRSQRVKLSELIGRLYTMRIFADYRPSVEVEGRDAREAISIMNTVFDSF